MLHYFVHVLHRYAGGVVPAVAKYTTQPIGLVKALPGGHVKSLYAQHGEYYVRNHVSCTLVVISLFQANICYVLLLIRIFIHDMLLNMA